MTIKSVTRTELMQHYHEAVRCVEVVIMTRCLNPSLPSGGAQQRSPAASFHTVPRTQRRPESDTGSTAHGLTAPTPAMSDLFTTFLNIRSRSSMSTNTGSSHSSCAPKIKSSLPSSTRHVRWSNVFELQGWNGTSDSEGYSRSLVDVGRAPGYSWRHGTESEAPLAHRTTGGESMKSERKTELSNPRWADAYVHLLPVYLT